MTATCAVNVERPYSARLAARTGAIVRLFPLRIDVPAAGLTGACCIGCDLHLHHSCEGSCLGRDASAICADGSFLALLQAMVLALAAGFFIPRWVLQLEWHRHDERSLGVHPADADRQVSLLHSFVRSNDGSMLILQCGM